MTDLDQWLADAAVSTNAVMPTSSLTQIDGRLAGEPLPQSLSARRDARRMMACAGFAALLGFTVTGGSGTFSKPSPTWISAPSASSPYSLLVGN